MAPDFVRLARRALIAEVVIMRDGRLEAFTTVPLVADEQVVMALPYADRAIVDTVARADEVLIACTDGRLIPAGEDARAAAGHVTVEHDIDGLRFADDLVDQLLRKHPPARLYGDTLMARREHWWWMSRFLCRFEPARSWVLPVRDDSAQGVLAWWDEEQQHLDATVAAPVQGRTTLDVPAGGHLPAVTSPALLLRHDLSVPDFEQRASEQRVGTLRYDEFRVDTTSGDLTLPPPAGLMTRYRARLALSRACRRELERARRTVR